MVNIELARPTAKHILDHIEEFESFCLGYESFSPEYFRAINEELSISAVLMIGQHRYQKDRNGKHLFWQGTDNREYDLGLAHEANIMRDFPGFHASRSRSLGAELVEKSEVMPVPNGKGNISKVTLQDGTTGIGPNYRLALRNAALKMHLKSKFNFLSAANAAWKSFWHKSKSFHSFF